MPKVTFEVTPQQRKLMDAHTDVNWSAVFRRAIERHAEAALLAQKILEEMEDPRIQAASAYLKQAVGQRWRRESRP